MRRRGFLLLGALAGSSYFPADAQQSGRVARIGLLWIASGETANYTKALREGLRSHGRVPGRNVVLDESFLVSHYDELPDAAKRLVAAKVDLIVTFGATAAQSAMRATGQIPIVFITGSDPLKAGLVSDLARPGGNATGVSASTEDVIGKRVEFFRAAFPSIRRAGLLHYPASSTEARQVESYLAAGQAIKLEIRPVEVRNPSEIEAVIGSLPSAKVDALLVMGSTMLLAHGTEVIAAIEKHRIPAIYSQPAFVDKGGLFSYGSDSSYMFGLASGYVDKILKGAKPGDLAVQQQNRFELVVNLKAARAQGIKFPNDLIARADRVIE